MNLGIIIQARMGSTRLPGKILMEFCNGKSILDFVLEKLHKVPNAKVIVATSHNTNNDKLEKYLIDRNEIVFRGEEDDVLERFISAAETNGVDSIIRICSDNPFIDLDGVLALVAEAQKKPESDYISFKINGTPSILTHFGFWGEFVKLEALKKVKCMTNETKAHEHVTYYIYNNPQIFNCQWIVGPEYLSNRKDIRLTIDTMEDLSNAQSVHRTLSKINANYTLKDIVDYLDKNPLLTDSMNNIIQNNIKK